MNIYPTKKGFLFPLYHDTIRMMKRFFVIWAFGLVWVATGCASPATVNVPESSTNIPVGSYPLPSTSPAVEVPDECDPSLSSVQTWTASLPYPEAVIIPQSYQEKSSLILWLVDPSLVSGDPELNQELAANQALFSALKIYQHTECVQNFDDIYASIVDSDYRLWFSGSFRTADLPGLQLEETGAGTEQEIGGGRISSSVGGQSAGAEASCSWKEASQILSQHFSKRNQPAVFYYLRDTGGANLYVHLVTSSPQGGEPAQQWVSEIYPLLPCLYAALDGITITLTLPNNQILLTGYQPLNPDGSYDPEKFTSTSFDQP